MGSIFMGIRNSSWRTASIFNGFCRFRFCSAILASSSSANASFNELELPSQNWFVKLKTKIKWLLALIVRKAGFFGILLCASIPNPLYDFAGITCGLYQVSFWTFFSATLLGKSNIFHIIMNIFIIIMAFYFIFSMIQSFANSYVKRITFVA
ncbi:hypothetical protein HZS_2073 [Henneguya salminicola]|nr:hypothetical protein HZS_2073 [Henneguya salminicola]